MYKGKYSNRKKRRLAPWAALALALVLTLSVGGTIAYLITDTGPVTNTFTPGNVACEVIESGWHDGNTTKENVFIRNTGNTDAYIRAAIVVTWQNEAGKVLAEAPQDKVDYTLSINTTGWKKQGDYYYCTMAGSPNTQTSVLINSCTVVKAKEGYSLCVDVLAQAIQSSPNTVESNTWNSDMTNLAVIKAGSN